MSVLKELNRRNVFRVALLYVVAAWFVLQVIGFIFAQLGIPDWTFRFIFALLVVCFPLVMVFSWIFKLTPEGIKREHNIEAQASITIQTGRKLNRVTMMLLALNIFVAVLENIL